MLLRGLLAGIVLTVGLAVLAGYIAIRAGILPANADARPSKFERWAASRSLRASVARGAPAGPNPLRASDRNLAAGLQLYAANCAVCHGASEGRGAQTRIARGLYQHPPAFADSGVSDDPAGVVYWKIRHGIRFTGMPAFTRTLSDKQLWQVTLFVQSLDTLPPGIARRWKALKV